jgi:hypothetical protein
LARLQLGLLADQIGDQAIGFARGGAVADADQVDLMLACQHGQGVQRAVPVTARFVRVDRGGVEQLAGGIDDGDLDAGAQAGVEAHGGVFAGGCGEQQVVQVGAKDADRFGFGALAQRVHQFQFEVQRGLDSPGPAHRFGSHLVGRPALVDDAEASRDARFAGVGRAWSSSSLSRTSASCSMPSLRPRNSASARCEGIARIASE